MKPKANPIIRSALVTAAVAALCIVGSAQAATYNWQGDVDSDFQTGGNWVENGWSEWGDYRFGSAVTSGTVSYNSGFGTARLYLDSGLTTDITIGGAERILMASAWGYGGTINIASDSKNLTINNAFWSHGATTWNVGANRTLTFNNGLSDWTGAGVGSLVKQGAGTAFLNGSSSYSGWTVLEGGILNVATFSDYGVNGGLGNRASDGGGNVGILFRGGTLQYTGSTAQSTNRGIRLSTTGGGGTIDASGSDSSATLSFTATSSPDFFEEGGNRTLTLTGSNTGNNTFAMAIGEAGGTTSLVKSGAGKWVISGSNSYSGGTALTGGTLALSGSGTLGATSGTLTINNATLDLGSTTQTVASVTSGGTGSNNSGAIIGAGTLNVSGNFSYQGNGGNSGAYGSNPTFTINSNLAVTGDTSVGRANLAITGGSLTTNRIISNAASADWARVVISGGTVTATNGIDGSVNTGATFAMDLDGGTLYTPSIKVADREAGPDNNAWLTFNGTTVKATADTGTFITTYGGGQNAYISNGGAILDTFDDVANTARSITIGVNLKDSNGHNGSLIKQGSGTLTLSGTNTYTGATTVNAGTLTLANNSAAGTGTVTLSGSSESHLKINSGTTIANAVTFSSTNGASSLIREVANGDAYTVGTNGTLKSSFSADSKPDTIAKILAGTNSGGATDLGMSFSTASGATNDGIRRSDVFKINGTTGSDLFVIELSSDSTFASDSVLAWLNNSNQWVQAATGTFFNNTAFNISTSGHFTLGSYGYDAGRIWAVVDHGGSFTAVPEPTSALAGLLITAGLLRRRRR